MRPRRCLFVAVATCVGLLLSLLVTLARRKSQAPYRGTQTVPRLVGEPSAYFKHQWCRGQDDSPMLLIMIHSRGDYEGFLRREAIRNTWLSQGHRKTDYRFVLGVKDISTEKRLNISKEQKRYFDMVLLEDVTDSHDTLTLRTIRTFQYAVRNHTHFVYMLKCDDDTFVDLVAVKGVLQKRNSTTRLLWEEFQGSSPVQLSGAFAEYNWFICDTYLPYAFGGGYIISRDLLELVLRNEPCLKRYNNEDTTLGGWLAPYSIEYMHDATFNTGSLPRGCKVPFIVIPKISPRMLTLCDYHEALETDGHFRNVKNHIRYGHAYNIVASCRCIQGLLHVRPYVYNVSFLDYGDKIFIPLSNTTIIRIQ